MSNKGGGGGGGITEGKYVLFYKTTVMLHVVKSGQWL